MGIILLSVVVGIASKILNLFLAVLLASLAGVYYIGVSNCSLHPSERVQGRLTRVGQVRLVALDLVRNLLLALAKLLHVVRDNRSVSSGIHFGDSMYLWCSWFKAV